MCEKKIYKKESLVSNKRIARNTVLLYFRMFVMLGISLYTSRVTLQILGVDDFGIYNIVGGVVALFVFVSNALRNSAQRYISFCIGKGENVDNTFNMAIVCHIMMALLFVIIAETLGLWLVHTKLIIPPDRMFAAECVYQISILTFVANILHSPYNAAIISYEKIDFFAYFSIVDAILKLLAVLLLQIVGFDKLIAYSLFILFMSILGLIVLALYAYKGLSLKFRWFYSKETFLGIMGFSGWSMLSGCSVVGAQQGGNILLNIYHGVVANAAFGIANQVSNAVYGFVANFQSAFQPQIVKLYAANEDEKLMLLIKRTSMVSFYMLLLISFPFTISADFVLKLWLGNVPPYSSVFCVLMILYFLLESLQAPLWMLIGATGKMKGYTIWSAAITLFNIPLSWILLINGFPVYIVFVVRVFLNFVCCVIRPFYLKTLVSTFNIKVYLYEAALRPFAVTVSCILLYMIIKQLLLYIHPVISIILAIVIVVVVVGFIGFNKTEKSLIIGILLNKIKLIRSKA